MPFTSCNYRWQTEKHCLFTPFFIIVIYHVFLIFLFVLYCECFILWYYCFPENILFWEPICTEFPIYQSVRFYWTASLQRSRFLFLVSFFFFKLLVFASFDTEMLCGTAIILHWTSQKHSSLLFSKEQTRWKSENDIKPQTTELKRVLNTCVMEAA